MSKVRQRIYEFVRDNTNVTRAILIKEFPTYAKGTVYRHVNELIQSGEINQQETGVLTTEAISKTVPWPLHHILRDGIHDRAQLPFISEMITDPVRFRQIADDLVEEHGEDLSLLLINITVIMAVKNGHDRDLKQYYPEIQPADEREFQASVAKLRNAVSNHKNPDS